MTEYGVRWPRPEKTSFPLKASINSREIRYQNNFAKMLAIFQDFLCARRFFQGQYFGDDRMQQAGAHQPQNLEQFVFGAHIGPHDGHFLGKDVAKIELNVESRGGPAGY